MVHAEVDISNRGKHTKVTKKNIDSIPAFPIFKKKKTRIKVKFKTCVFLQHGVLQLYLYFANNL